MNKERDVFVQADCQATGSQGGHRPTSASEVADTKKRKGMLASKHWHVNTRNSARQTHGDFTGGAVNKRKMSRVLFCYLKKRMRGPDLHPGRVTWPQEKKCEG